MRKKIKSKSLPKCYTCEDDIWSGLIYTLKDSAGRALGVCKECYKNGKKEEKDRG